MSHELNAYLADLVALADLPTQRDRALSEAQRAGQSDIDRAEAEERRVRDSVEQVRRHLATCTDRLRRLEVRTGPVEPDDSVVVPPLTDLPRFLEGVVRDLDSAAKAQDWVERTRAASVQVPTPAAPTPVPVAPTIAPAPLTAPPAPVSNRPRTTLYAFVAAFVVVLVVSLLIVLLNR